MLDSHLRLFNHCWFVPRIHRYTCVTIEDELSFVTPPRKGVCTAVCDKTEFACKIAVPLVWKSDVTEMLEFNWASATTAATGKAVGVGDAFEYSLAMPVLCACKFSVELREAA